MKPLRFLNYVHHQARSLIVMAGLLVLYCLWFWLLSVFGWIDSDSSARWVGFLLLVPLLPVALFDLWLRLSWQPETPRLYPPPPSLLEKLFYPEYGLFWFPVLIMIPLWVWGSGLIGWSLYLWMFG